MVDISATAEAHHNIASDRLTIHGLSGTDKYTVASLHGIDKGTILKISHKGGVPLFIIDIINNTTTTYYYY